MKITLCGSYAFQSQIEEIARQLEKMGHEVRFPMLEVGITMTDGSKTLSIADYIKEHGGIDVLSAGDVAWQEKGKAIDDHVAKIASTDVVLIVNYTKKGIAGYIGGNTLMEMAVARHLGKRIYLTNRPSSQLPYAEEIFGLQPTIINEDLSKII